MVRRILAASGVRPGEEVEPQVWSEGRAYPGKCNILPESVALEQAKNERAEGTIWTDGSRLEDGRVGAACSWQTREGWTGRRFFLSNNKVFDAELFAICRAVRVLEARGQEGRRYIFSDSQAAIRRALNDSLGPGQQWARAIIEVVERVVARNNHI